VGPGARDLAPALRPRQAAARRVLLLLRAVRHRRFAFADKTRFLGRSIQDRIIRQCNVAEWWFIAHDKLVFYGLLTGLNLPVPQTRALYQGEGRFAAVPVFAKPAALAAHLRAGMRYPFFGKPVTGIRSIGVAAVERYDPGGDALVFMGGSTLALDGFVRSSSPIASRVICSRRCCARIQRSSRCADRVCQPCG
jgi:hypothetical protein